MKIKKWEYAIAGIEALAIFLLPLRLSKSRPNADISCTERDRSTGPKGRYTPHLSGVPLQILNPVGGKDRDIILSGGLHNCLWIHD